MVNKLMIQVCFVDLIFSGLVKMRLFNGYMADDVVLTSFCLLAGYSDALNKEFVSGAQEMKEKLRTEYQGQNPENSIVLGADGQPIDVNNRGGHGSNGAQNGGNGISRFPSNGGRSATRTKSMPPLDMGSSDGHRVSALASQVDRMRTTPSKAQ